MARVQDMSLPRKVPGAAGVPDAARGTSFKPGAGSNPVDSADFCGKSCHGTFWDVKRSSRGERRHHRQIEPYRLESRSAGTRETRGSPALPATTPMNRSRRGPLPTTRPAGAAMPQGHIRRVRPRRQLFCPVASKDRAFTRHMPKVDVPSMHTKFTDHSSIRIAREGEAYPE